MAKFRVAAVQAGSILFDIDRTTAKAVEWLDAAAAAGADLVVFPEAFLGGYPKGLDFGARVGSRSDQGRAMFRRYFESAIEAPGPATEAIGAACRERGVHAVMGCIERDGGTLYCSALYFSPEGALIGKRRKLMPTAMERLIWGFGDASTLDVVQTPLGRIGAVICWENYMPLLRAAMYQKGIQIYCAPTVDDRDAWAGTMRHIALEGRCFVISACQFLRRGDCPADYPAIQGDAPETVLIRGGSVIVDPLGRLLAGPRFDGECVVTADIDTGVIAEGKFDLDVAGHYARPDIFQLIVG
ncbi:MAG: carbon-nitrogen hydrolase family protein [Acidobacteria bacterium]|nr:carbon-nitrogen hydrolase family protein [Acidobacteriota bacterium]